MRAFIDANVIVYANVSPDPDLGRRCVRILAHATRPGSGLVTSTLVLEELLHLELSGRLAGVEGMALDACDALAPLLPLTEDVLRGALRLAVPGEVGSADRIHVATCQEAGIPAIVSADRAFDGVRGLKRIDPFDERAVARLLTG